MKPSEAIKAGLLAPHEFAYEYVRPGDGEAVTRGRYWCDGIPMFHGPPYTNPVAFPERANYGCVDCGSINHTTGDASWCLVAQAAVEKGTS